MEILKFIIVLICSYVVGVFGWAQIVGGFQNLKERGAPMVITIVLWTAILIGSFVVVLKLFSSCIWAWIVAIVISLVQVLRQGKIE